MNWISIILIDVSIKLNETPNAKNCTQFCMKTQTDIWWNRRNEIDTGNDFPEKTKWSENFLDIIAFTAWPIPYTRGQANPEIKP